MRDRVRPLVGVRWVETEEDERFRKRPWRSGESQSAAGWHASAGRAEREARVFVFLVLSGRIDCGSAA